MTLRPSTLNPEIPGSGRRLRPRNRSVRGALLPLGVAALLIAPVPALARRKAYTIPIAQQIAAIHAAQREAQEEAQELAQLYALAAQAAVSAEEALAAQAAAQSAAIQAEAAAQQPTPNQPKSSASK